MHGEEEAELDGHNIDKAFPFISELTDKKTGEEKFPGFLSSLKVKTRTNKQKNFEDIVLIDTPGLADGHLRYKFNIEEAIMWLASHCDLVYVFLDPIGQALCKKTNQLI